MKILIDNGHGSNTPGKCSPDRRYHEWSYTRQIAAAIVRQLKYSGYDADLLVPEDYDVSLRARVERARMPAWSPSTPTPPGTGASG